MRGRFLWRVGFFFTLVFLLITAVLSAAIWIASSVVGGLRAPLFIGPLGVMAVMFLVLLGLLAGRGLRRMAAPIGDLIEAAGRVAGGDYSARVPERGPPEVRALAKTFNEMANRLQLTDEHRRTLLADITHDLRTPLTVIQGNLEGLLDGVYPRDDLHLVPILEETRLLARLVDDLRTLALSEAGELKLRGEPTDLGLLIGETAASFQGQAAAAGVSLTTTVAADVPTVDVDPARIRQVLENLIVNALRYTPRGGTVRVTCVSRSNGDGPRVVVSVRDTGVGIPADELPHIFDRFYKARDSRGSGLGLTIARNLISAHRGTMAAESEPGRGTTIWFNLPTGSQGGT